MDSLLLQEKLTKFIYHNQYTFCYHYEICNNIFNLHLIKNISNSSIILSQQMLSQVQSSSSFRSQRRQSKLISRQVFNEHMRKKRRLHSNSIFNQLKICDKLNQFTIMQEKNLKIISKKNRMSKTHQSQIFPNQNIAPTSSFFQICKKQKTNKQKFQKNQSPLIKIPKKKKYTFGNVQAKLKQLKKISQAFDVVNNIRISLPSQKQFEYKVKYTQTDKLLKDFSEKLSLRKNMITQRKDQLKKNVIRDYRFKALPKKIVTQQNQPKILQNKGIWFENAKRLKNYICGGYTDQRQEYSDQCAFQQYRKIKRNFVIFQNIYNSIKEDKSNPISKVNTVNFKNPTTLQVVSYLERYQTQPL